MLRFAMGIAFIPIGLVGIGVRADEPGGSLDLDDTTRSRCLEILRAGLDSDEFWPAMHAAEALSLVGLGDEVREALLPRLPEEADAQRRCGLARELTRAGDLAFVRVLLEILASPDPHGHVHACESLFKVRQVGDGRLLRSALARADQPRLRLMAAAALARWGSPDAFEVLRESVLDPEGETARVAAWILARVGDDSDLPALRDGAERFEDPLTRAYFQHALAALGDGDGALCLLRNLAHPDPSVRVYAAEFAPEARIVEARAPLRDLLDDPVLDVRIRAAQALLQLARPAPPDPSEVVVRDVFPATTANPRYSEGSVLVRRDGGLLHAITEFQDDESDFAAARIVGVESTDGGRSWSAPRVLQENTGRQNVMSATLLRLRDPAGFEGPIGLFYLVKNSPAELKVFLRVSEDEGVTFGEPFCVTADPGYHVLNNDRVTVLSTGRLVVPVASTGDVVAENRFVAACYLSDDGGRTWRRGRGEVAYPRRGAMEPEVIERDDGRLLMHIRSQLGHIAVSKSSDGGETWTEAVSWTVEGPESPATLRRIPSTGDWLLIWNDAYREGEDHGGKRTPLTAAISHDEGRTWSHRRDIEADPNHTYAYTSLAFHEGRALLTCYVRDEATGRISSRFRSIPIAWFYQAAGTK